MKNANHRSKRLRAILENNEGYCENNRHEI